jgi:hypothetical protein
VNFQFVLEKFPQTLLFVILMEFVHLQMNVNVLLHTLVNNVKKLFALERIQVIKPFAPPRESAILLTHAFVNLDTLEKIVKSTIASEETLLIQMFVLNMENANL